MFQEGEYIIYGSSGACRVERVGVLPYGSGKEERLCYTLIPCRDPGSTIFTPVDNQKVLMRPVMTREEAMELIDQMREISPLWIQNERKREEEYREAVRTCDGRELVRIIKTIYLRRRKRMSEGKKITAADSRYFKLAEDNLFGELAVSLELERDKVKDFIEDKIGAGES